MKCVCSRNYNFMHQSCTTFYWNAIKLGSFNKSAITAHDSSHDYRITIHCAYYFYCLYIQFVSPTKCTIPLIVFNVITILDRCEDICGMLCCTDGHRNELGALYVNSQTGAARSKVCVVVQDWPESMFQMYYYCRLVYMYFPNLFIVSGGSVFRYT